MFANESEEIVWNWGTNTNSTANCLKHTVFMEFTICHPGYHDAVPFPYKKATLMSIRIPSTPIFMWQLFCWRLEVVGARKNGCTRRRHARGLPLPSRVSLSLACDHALSLYLCNLFSAGGHDTFLSQITFKKARIWIFFWLDRKQYGWFALSRLAETPPSVSCWWFQSAFLLA